ncbi:MAG: trypsin-like peptidase domain-containing protein [Chromatiaceae bacterium]
MEHSGTTAHLITALAAGAAGALLTLWLAGLAPDPSLEGDEAPALGTATQAMGGMGSLADAVGRSAPAVVSIFASRLVRGQESKVSGLYLYPYAPPRPSSRETRETALGSGVILSADGLILTNRHVVKDADSIRVLLADGRRLEVAVLGLDSETDLAVLKARAAGLPAAPIGDPKALRVGDLTLAIGNPFGVGQTVTQGIVSATGRAELGITPIENFIQTDAAINPGNSGGALVNARGELVGINTAIYSESGAAGGIGFAIPSDLALKVARTIVEQGNIQRGWIGMSGRSVTPELAETFGLRAPRGVLVSSTLEDSPAEHAGLRPGDVVTRVGDREVATIQELLDAIAGSGPNQPLSLEVWRGSQRLQTNAVTAERPAQAQ